MNAPVQAYLVAVALFGAMSAYALFSGADFGGGMWDVVAGRTERGRAARSAIHRSTTPVWEANNVWIIFGLVLVWTSFPAAFAALMSALFVPLALSLLGIVLRALEFAFRQEIQRLPFSGLTSIVFSGSAVLTPFFLGTAVGAVVTGGVRVGGPSDATAAWTGAVPLVTGGLFVAMCLLIGAVYLVGDSARRDDPEMVRYFTVRAIVGAGLSGLLAAGNLALLHLDAGYVFERLLHTSYPLVIVSVAAGVGSILLLLGRRTLLLRPTAAVAVTGVIAAWAWAQYPYVFPKTLTLAAASANTATLDVQLIIVAVAAVLVAPSFAALYVLQQRDELQERPTSGGLRRAVDREQGPGAPEAAAPSRVLMLVVAALAIAGAIRDLAGRRPS